MLFALKGAAFRIAQCRPPFGGAAFRNAGLKLVTAGFLEANARFHQEIERRRDVIDREP